MLKFHSFGICLNIILQHFGKPKCWSNNQDISEKYSTYYSNKEEWMLLKISSLLFYQFK